MKKIFLTIFSILFFIPVAVSADELTEYYTNKNNVKMTIEQYKRLVEVYGEIAVENMPQNIFDNEKNMIYVKLNEETKYIETKYTKDTFGNILKTEENEITKEKYNKSILTSNNPIIRNSNPTHETTYKKLTITEYGANPGSDGGYTASRFLLTTDWKSMPSVRSYDVTGFRFQNFNVTLSTIWGQLRYSTDGSLYTVQNYDTSSSGYKAPGGGGFGISMKLPSSTAIKSIQSQVSATGTYTNMTTYGAYGSYQHATSNVSETSSKLYTISSTGMGKVFKFNSSVSSKYDNTQGVSTGGYNF